MSYEFKAEVCRCRDRGCEECCCDTCGDWLERYDDLTCKNCIEQYDEENEI